MKIEILLHIMAKYYIIPITQFFKNRLYVEFFEKNEKIENGKKVTQFFTFSNDERRVFVFFCRIKHILRK